MRLSRLLRIRVSPGSCRTASSARWGAANGGRRRTRGNGCASASAISSRGNAPRAASWRSTRSRAFCRFDGMNRRVVAHRRARQSRQQSDLAEGQPVRRLAEVEPRRRAHPFDVAAIGSQIEIDLQQLGLREPPLELHRPERSRSSLRGNVRGPGSAMRAICIGIVDAPDTTSPPHDSTTPPARSPPDSPPDGARTTGPRKPREPAAARPAARKAAPETATADPPAGRTGAARRSGPSPPRRAGGGGSPRGRGRGD